jgi:hypothetical protein
MKRRNTYNDFWNALFVSFYKVGMTITINLSFQSNFPDPRSKIVFRNLEQTTNLKKQLSQNHSIISIDA